MGSIISKIADEVALHGTYEKYVTWRDQQDIPYFPEPEVVEPEKVEPKLKGYNSAHFYFDEIKYFSDPEPVIKKRDMDRSHMSDAIDYLLMAKMGGRATPTRFPAGGFFTGGVKKVYYLRENDLHDDQKGSNTDSVGNIEPDVIYGDDGRG